MDRFAPTSAKNLPEGLILFDGVCLFCSRWVRFVIRRDAARRFRFAPLQSPYGRAAAARIGIDPDAPETNAVILGGRALFKSDAAIAVLSALPGSGWTAILSAAPKRLRDVAYDCVAQNRYRLFGKAETCFRPAPEDRDRFLDAAAPPL